MMFYCRQSAASRFVAHPSSGVNKTNERARSINSSQSSCQSLITTQQVKTTIGLTMYRWRVLNNDLYANVEHVNNVPSINNQTLDQWDIDIHHLMADSDPDVCLYYPVQCYEHVLPLLNHILHPDQFSRYTEHYMKLLNILCSWVGKCQTADISIDHATAALKHCRFKYISNDRGMYVHIHLYNYVYQRMRRRDVSLSTSQWKKHRYTSIPSLMPAIMPRNHN